MKLNKGQNYNTDLLTCTGWTEGDGSGHDGYDWMAYFLAVATAPGPLGLAVATSGEAAYLGPDESGIEPLFDALSAHLASLTADSISDIAAGRWDEVMTDALYAAIGAESLDEMEEARQSAQAAAKKHRKLFALRPTP